MGIFRKPRGLPGVHRLMVEAKERAEVELFGFCLMPSHWWRGSVFARR
jgi:hypothetical protein